MLPAPCQPVSKCQGVLISSGPGLRGLEARFQFAARDESQAEAWECCTLANFALQGPVASGKALVRLDCEEMLSRKKTESSETRGVWSGRKRTSG